MNAHVIILSGQSNACGVARYKLLRSKLGEEKYKEFFEGYQNVLIRYWSHGQSNKKFEKVRLFDGFSSCDVNECFGPELGIAEFLSRKTKEKIYIIKWSYGGASLDFDFASPSADNTYMDCLIHGDKYGWCYEGLINLVKESLEQIKKEGFNPIIESFLWMQGESDACDDAITRYSGKFNSLINDFKKEFSDYISENFLTIDAGICEHSHCWPLATEMNELKRQMSLETKRTIFLDTEKAGLETMFEPLDQPDIYHYDSFSMLRLGNMFADAYAKEFIK